eukprot:4034918-Amphidinium_carterae.1
MAGSIDATLLTEGYLQSCLLNPELVMKPANLVPDRLPQPQIWADDETWGKLAATLVARRILVVIDEQDIHVHNGRKVLSGLFAVPKASNLKKIALDPHVQREQRL